MNTDTEKTMQERVADLESKVQDLLFVLQRTADLLLELTKKCEGMDHRLVSVEDQARSLDSRTVGLMRF